MSRSREFRVSVVNAIGVCRTEAVAMSRTSNRATDDTGGPSSDD
jgi:hypothetical protein